MLGNISTRLSVGTDDYVLIGGFVITGDTSKKVILRGIGPSLSRFGVPNSLQDPTLDLYNSAGQRLASNDNWPSSASEFEIFQSGFAPKDSRESAILTMLTPGPYTTIVRGKNRSTGVGLVEVYDLDTLSQAKLINISTRGFVQTGDNVMIGGWVITGRNPARVVIRALGPSLTRLGVPSALADPMLELFDNRGQLLFSNDNWQDHQRIQLQESGLAPHDNREAAILLTLDPGAYTAVVRGKNLTTGQALIELYEIN